MLLSWGPLCYGAVHVGAPLDGEAREQAKHKYAACQDMDQAWSSTGIDAVVVTSVEFCDVADLDFSPASVEAWEAKVADLDGPGGDLLVRYD